MKNFLKLSVLLFIIAIVFNSCEKEEEDFNGPQITDNDAVSGSGMLKGSAAARTITLKANTLTCPGGICTQYGVSSTDKYTVWFTVKFNSGFYWSRGGKLGYGFLIGDGNTGCDKASDGNGGSARFMWYCPNGSNTNKGSGAYFQPYVYYKDMPGTCGNSFGKKYYVSENTTYNCQISVKLNTGTSTNGYVKYYVNGTEMLNQTIRWVTNDSKRRVNAVSFHVFRGGSQYYWTAPQTSSIYFGSASWSAV